MSAQVSMQGLESCEMDSTPCYATAKATTSKFKLTLCRWVHLWLELYAVWCPTPLQPQLPRTVLPEQAAIPDVAPTNCTPMPCLLHDGPYDAQSRRWLRGRRGVSVQRTWGIESPTLLASFALLPRL
jgi:hypothetical protein